MIGSAFVSFGVIMLTFFLCKRHSQVSNVKNDISHGPLRKISCGKWCHHENISRCKWIRFANICNGHSSQLRIRKPQQESSARFVHKCIFSSLLSDETHDVSFAP